MPWPPAEAQPVANFRRIEDFAGREGQLARRLHRIDPCCDGRRKPVTMHIPERTQMPQEAASAVGICGGPHDLGHGPQFIHCGAPVDVARPVPDLVDNGRQRAVQTFRPYPDDRPFGKM